MIKNGLQLDYKVEFITTGGENLYEFQRKIMKKAFGVYPYSHYGLSEGVANFSENKEHRMIIDEDFAAVELSPLDDGTYKIIGTNLTNYSMPLLRWDTGDRAICKDLHMSPREREIIQVDGRSGEHIILPNGTKIGALSALFTETVNVSEAQLYQKSNYDLIIYLVISGINYKEDEKMVKNLLLERIGNSINIEFKYVEKIPRTNSGKLRYVISEIEH